MNVVEMKPAPKPKPPVQLDELRCPSCNRLIARVRLVPGAAVETYCRHCKRWMLKECA